MKPSWSFPIVVGSAAVGTLLLALAIVVLLVTRRIDRDAVLIATDSVPGLVDATLIRTAAIEEFEALEVAGRQDVSANRMTAVTAAYDGRVKRAISSYRQTIRIDEPRDTELLNGLMAARDRYVPARNEFVASFADPAKAAGRGALRERLTDRYRDLVTACGALVAYNSQTGTRFAAHMSSLASVLRWAALGVIVLVAFAVLLIAGAARREIRIARETRQSAETLVLAFRVSPHAMVIARLRDSMIIAANAAFQRQFGVENQEVVGRRAIDLGIWGAPAQREIVLGEFKAHGRLVNYVRKRTLSDGREQTLLISAEPIVLDGDDCLLAVGHDISDRIRAEAALTRSEAELRTIVEHAGIGIALVNPQGRLIRANPALERFLGYLAGQARGMSFVEFTHPDDLARDVEKFQQLVSGDVYSYRLEKRYRRKDGATVWAHLTTSGVRDAAGKLEFVVGMVEDITERKRSEVALHESEAARHELQRQFLAVQKLEALGQLAGGVAHDFNNILAAITLYLDVLKMEPSVSRPMQDSIEELQKIARRAAGLTRQLLLFSRREPAHRQIIDLRTVVSQLLKMLDRLVGRQYTLTHVHDDKPLWVRADPGMVEQVVMNLIVNARDAMPRGGPIRIRTDAVELDEATAREFRAGRAGAYARLIVTDSGCGMSESVKQRIFEPFFTTKEAGKGTGLGLSTVFGIVRQHDGWIDVVTAEGKGATFAIGFPLHDKSAKSAPLIDARPAPGKGNESILVAEDDDAVRAVLRRVLSNVGYRVTEAANGREARALLAANGAAFDLLLSDVIMPGGLLGTELADLVREQGRPKIILMSAHTAAVDVEALAATGGVYLSKPFNTDHLLRTVRATFDGQPPPESPRSSA